jgi:hypothetical protein
MTRLRLPGPEDLAAEPHLAAITVLELACVLAATALRASHLGPSTLGYPQAFGGDLDYQEIATAQAVFTPCATLRDALVDHRRAVTARLRRERRRPDWPF